MAAAIGGDRAGRWNTPVSGPTATGAQRARRRRAGRPVPRALVFSRRPVKEDLAAALAREGLEIEWTDSGPGAIGEAVEGSLAVCVIIVGRQGAGELDYLPCLNQADPLLPVIVVNDRDSLEMQRKIRSHRVFYYLMEPLHPAEFAEALRAAMRGRDPGRGAGGEGARAASVGAGRRPPA